MLRLIVIALFIACYPCTGWGQHYSLLEQEEDLEQVKNITQLIYNAQFQQADLQLSALKNKVPANHPVLPLLQAITLYWQAAPMHPDAHNFDKFIGLLHKTNQNADYYLENGYDKIVTTFCTLTAHSLLARYHAEKGDKMAAIKEARVTYGFMKQGFELQNQYNEFYFSTGLYNYYREKYPEQHPVYKPFMWLFEDGDKDKGLQQLEYAARHAVFTKVEAATFLVHLYLYYENQPQKALPIIRLLYQQFSGNRYVRLQLTESLLASGHYVAATPHVAFLQQHKDHYYHAAGTLFAGILAEKQHRNYAQAHQLYQKALEIAKPLNYIGDTYRSMAHAGIARYHEANQQKDKARAAWQAALDLAAYEYPVKQEAKQKLQ